MRGLAFLGIVLLVFIIHVCFAADSEKFSTIEDGRKEKKDVVEKFGGMAVDSPLTTDLVPKEDNDARKERITDVAETRMVRPRRGRKDRNRRRGEKDGKRPALFGLSKKKMRKCRRIQKNGGELGRKCINFLEKVKGNLNREAPLKGAGKRKNEKRKKKVEKRKKKKEMKRRRKNKDRSEWREDRARAQEGTQESMKRSKNRKMCLENNECDGGCCVRGHCRSVSKLLFSSCKSSCSCGADASCFASFTTRPDGRKRAFGKRRIPKTGVCILKSDVTLGMGVVLP